MKLTIFTIALTIALTLSAQSAKADTWDAANDPANIEKNYEYRVETLPMKGFVAAEKTPWSETYWPSQKGSINFRWHSANPIGFRYYSPSRDQAKSMTKEELSQLSPAEKYDLFMGRYDYPLKSEVIANSSRRAKEWAGICHGWSPAALQYVEPKSVTMTNPDGIEIPFGASDVKGLLSYFMAFHADLEVSQVGKRCYKAAEILGRGSCHDINPGALHVVLANELGIGKRGIIADVDRRHEVWNQPVYGYESEVIGSANLRGSAVHVKTKMYYTDELETSEWEPISGTDKFKFKIQELEYYLELDGQGRIVGGEWINTAVRPDFVWKVHNEGKFAKEFIGLEKIYQPIH